MCGQKLYSQNPHMFPVLVVAALIASNNSPETPPQTPTSAVLRVPSQVCKSGTNSQGGVGASHQAV